MSTLDAYYEQAELFALDIDIDKVILISLHMLQRTDSWNMGTVVLSWNIQERKQFFLKGRPEGKSAFGFSRRKSIHIQGTLTFLQV